MKILIISKYYHSNQAARAIQMRRVVSALLRYTDHEMILITEGDEKHNSVKEYLQIVNIPAEKKDFSRLEKIFDLHVCSVSCIRDNAFIRQSVEIANEYIRKYDVKLLFTVSSPFDSHIAGLKIKNQHSGIQWISYFSDLWPNVLQPKPHYQKKLFSSRELSAMEKVAGKSDAIITSNEYCSEIIKQTFDYPAEIYTIRHCMENQPDEKKDLLKGYVVHAGLLSKMRIKEDLIISINQLAKENPLFKGFIQIGSYDRILTKLMKKHHCKAIYVSGTLPEELARNIQQMIEISMIIEAPMKDTSPFMPSKITDNLSKGKKIIVITPEHSFLRDFAQNRQGVYCCSYNAEEIKASINDALTSNDGITEDTVNYFHPSVVASKYSEIFQKMIKKIDS